MIKPLKLIRAVYFSDYLKDQRDFTRAMGAAHAFDHTDDESGDRDCSKDPSTSSLRRTLKKLDILDCLLWRREFAAAQELDLLFSVNLFTDSSPVSGYELQGLVMDVHWTNDEGERIILPGSTLEYGLFDATNKTLGLLHAIWLVAGPEHKTVWYVCTKVTSVTTDMGVEIGTLVMPDMVLAYCQFMAGTPFESCGPLVNRSRRWIPRALRISGWSHAWGNISKACAEKIVQWPSVLEKMRALIGFFRVATWRTHVAKCLRQAGAEPVHVKAVEEFACNIAKWRYETVEHSMAELLQVRTTCQRFIRAEWFSNPQDREQLKAVLDACGDEWLWRFIAVTHKQCFQPIELSRHWGMVCNHPECKDKRDAGQKHVPCWGNSRRLAEAVDFVTGQAAAWKAEAIGVSVDDCEGDVALRSQVQTTKRQMASSAKQRFAYLRDPPWSAVLCLSVEGAKNVVSQVESRPLADHDDLTRDIVQRVGQSIRKRARGEDVDPELARECKRLKTSPLDEGAGEGYHRSANKELKRADASSTIALKQKCRRKGTFAHVKRFARKHGKRGERVIDFEFRRWKRILQGSAKRKWKGVQRRDQAVLKAVYREDDRAALNWQNIVAPSETARPVVPDEIDNKGVCENEYLRGLMQLGERYTLRVPRDEPGERPNEVRTVDEPIHFHLLGLSWGGHRPKLIHTVTSADNAALNAPMAMEILPHTERQRDPDDPPGPLDAVEVYPDADAKWMCPTQLGDFRDFIKHLTVWKRTECSPTMGCEMWRQGERAVVRFNVLDDKCPVLALIYHLQSKGWISSSGRIVHRTVDPGPFDAKEAIKFRQYYQVLAVLDRCLPLTTEVPSRQCIGFYKCLLRGLRVEPDQSAKHYTLVINSDNRKKGHMAEVLPVEDIQTTGVGAPDPDGIILPGAEQPPPLPAPARRQSVATGSRRRKEAPKALAGPPAVHPPIVAGPPGGPTSGGGSGGSAGGAGGGCPPVHGGGDTAPGGAPAPDPDGVILGAGTGTEGMPQRLQQEPRQSTAGLFDTVVQYQPYVTPAGKSYPNFIMLCSEHTPPCSKTKGMTPANTKRWGRIQPLCFLHAWNCYKDPEGVKTHSQVNPTPALVDDMAREHGAEMEAILEELGL